MAWFEEKKPKRKSEQEEVNELLASSKKLEEEAKEWDLPEYEQYLADLYFFIGPSLGWSQQDFDNTSIDLVYYYRDRLLESIGRNAEDDPKAMPVNLTHWGLIFTMKRIFGSKKKR